MTNAEVEANTESRAMVKALKLCHDMPPEFNIQPTIDLIRAAWRLGLEVVRPDPTGDGT